MTTLTYWRERCKEVRAIDMACDLSFGVSQEAATRENGNWSVSMRVAELEEILDHAEAQERAVQQAQVEILRAGVAELEAKREADRSKSILLAIRAAMGLHLGDGVSLLQAVRERRGDRARWQNALASLRRVGRMLLNARPVLRGEEIANLRSRLDAAQGEWAHAMQARDNALAALRRVAGMLLAAKGMVEIEQGHSETLKTLLELERTAHAEVRAALEGLLRYAECETCEHEETYRGGAIWEICTACGAKWADDEGGKPPYQEPPAFTAARAALAKGGE